MTGGPVPLERGQLGASVPYVPSPAVINSEGNAFIVTAMHAAGGFPWVDMYVRDAHRGVASFSMLSPEEADALALALSVAAAEVRRRQGR